MKPINNFIIFKKLPISSEFSWKSMDTVTDIQRWGEVTGVGPGSISYLGKIHKPPIDIGQIVYVARHGIHHFPDSEECLASEFDVLLKTTTLPDGKIDMENMKPLGNLILLEVEKEFDSEEEFVVITQTRLNTGIGKVIRLGTGYTNLQGETQEFQVTEGDRVKFIAENTIKIDGLLVDQETDYLLVSHNDIMAVLE